MSKESKPRDRWRQHYQATRDRPADHCIGCGYHFRVYSSHRPDCMVAYPKGDQTTQDWHAAYLARVGAPSSTTTRIEDW